MELDTKSLQKRVARTLNRFVKDKKEIKAKDQWIPLKDPAFFADVTILEKRYAVNAIMQFLGTQQKPVILFTIPIKVNENTFQIGANEYKTQEELEDACEKIATSFSEMNFR